MSKLGIKALDRSRYMLSNEISDTEISEIKDNPNVRVVQFSQPLNASTFKRLNVGLFAARPDLQLRAYGYYGLEACDLSFVSIMTNVENFSADCLFFVKNIEALGTMPKLRHLSIGSFELQDFKFLDLISHDIETLNLQATRSKKPDLASLNRFKKITKLYLEGQSKNIEVIMHLSNLEKLTLRSITTENLDYLKRLSKLWSLEIKLGGTKNLGAIAEMANIKYLELWKIMGLVDIGVISTLYGLQFLFLQDLTRIDHLPSFHKLTHLRRIDIDNLKSLKSLDVLQTSPALQEFRHTQSHLTPEQYRSLLSNTKLKKASAGFGNVKKNSQFEKMRDEYGIVKLGSEKFEFS